MLSKFFFLGTIALWRRNFSPEPQAETKLPAEDISFAQAVKMGFFTNALNPKCTLFFLAMFTQVIGPETTLAVKMFFGGEILFIAFAWFSLVSFLLTMEKVQSVIARFEYYAEKAVGAVLIGLGIKLALFSQR